METLTVSAGPTHNTVIRGRPAAIYIDGLRRRDLKLLSWQLLPSPRFGLVRIALHSSTQSDSPVRAENITALPPIGAKIVADAGGGEKFYGAVTSHVVEIDEKGERLVAEVEHKLAAHFAVKISKLHVISGSDIVEIENTALVFNVGTDTFASDNIVSLSGRQTRVFDPTSRIRRWSVADALAYVIAAGVPDDIEVPGREEIASMVGEVDLGPMDLTNMTVGKALAEIAARGGCVFRATRRDNGLLICRTGRSGRRRRVSLQPAGAALSLQQTNLWQGQIVFRRRPSRRTVLAIGGYKLYESTFVLHKGWDPALETGRWRDFIRSEADDWLDVADVYRKWVLNEHGGYCDSPYNLPLETFSSVSAGDFQLQIPRKFLPCISCDTFNESLGIVVEVRYDSGSWRRWTNPAWALEDQCAIYLGGDALPGEFFQAAVSDQLQVRVTATVRSDKRLVCQIEGDSGCIREIVDVADRVAWRKVHSGSTFYGQEGLPEPNERDDATMLENIARRYVEVLSQAMEAELSLGWIDTSFQVGDIVERIDGRALELSSNPDSRPFVRAVRHDFDSQTTRLTVSG